MGEALTLVTEIDNDESISLNQKIFWTKKIVQQTGGNGKQIFVYKDYPDIEVEYSDLKRIKDEDTYKSVMEELSKKNVVTEPVTQTSSEPVKSVVNNSESVQSPVEIPKVEAPAAPDMLTNTGYTVVMPPVDANMVELEAPVTPEVPVKQPVESIQRAPKKMTKKPISFNRGNSQSGFAEVIVLAVVVLVYIAIIVNLIIRLN